MVLSDEQIREFQEIYKEHFGTEISKEEAYENGTKLLRLISLLYHPVDQEKLQTVAAPYAKILKKVRTGKSNDKN